MKTHWVISVVVCLSVTACEQAPTKEIDVAEAALEQARSGGADVFAPERFGEAQAALSDAKRKIEASDYRGALSSASDAGEKSRAALQSAIAAKQLARDAAHAAEAEAQAALDEVAAIRERAEKLKIPDQAFAGLLLETAEASTALDAVAGALAEGKILEAKKLAIETRARVTPLPARFREAQAKWQAAHPAGRRARKR